MAGGDAPATSQHAVPPQDVEPGSDGQRAARRRVVAGWVSEATGAAVPFRTRAAFAAALRDGAVLVDLVNAVDPNASAATRIAADATPGGGERNVEAFLAACTRLGVSEDDLFADIGDADAVADCLHHLKMVIERRQRRRESMNTALSAAQFITKTRSSAERGDTSSSKELAGKMGTLLEFGMSRLQADAGTDGGACGGEGAAGMALVTPVLESVLAKITREYERRLLEKEKQLSAMREDVRTAEEREGGLLEQVELALGALEEAQERTRDASTRHEAAVAREAAANLKAAAAQEELEAMKATRTNSGKQAGPAAAVDRERLASAAQSASELRAALSSTRSDTRSQLARRDVELEQLAGCVRKLSERAHGLEEQAGKYAEMVIENRRLFNQVLDLKGAIRVFCRVRPLLGAERTGGAEPAVRPVPSDQESLTVTSTGFGNDRKQTTKAFSYNRVFGPNVTQEEVYADTQPLIRSVCDGYNVCIFAYGQTGSGKTHTMSGPGRDGPREERGVIYRSLEDLFALRDQRSEEVSYVIEVQMLEIYNEQLRDLLVDSNAAPQKLDVRFLPRGGSEVEGLTTREVECEDDIFELMAEGERNRATAGTSMNERSSRSHSVALVNVRGEHHVTGMRTSAVLYLVDLAGSERVSRSEAEGDRLKEAQHINKSLSALGDVMHALQSRSAHVPFRNSKLTALLQGALQPGGKTMMFVHVSPHDSSTSETLSTLGFASRVSTVELGRAGTNTQVRDSVEAKGSVSKLQDELRSAQLAAAEASRLRKELDAERERTTEERRRREKAEEMLAAARRRSTGIPQPPTPKQRSPEQAAPSEETPGSARRRSNIPLPPTPAQRSPEEPAATPSAPPRENSSTTPASAVAASGRKIPRVASLTVATPREKENVAAGLTSRGTAAVTPRPGSARARPTPKAGGVSSSVERPASATPKGRWM